jgi:ubiquinone/menaquinone biosynthesis C-methylase UbiE
MDPRHYERVWDDYAKVWNQIAKPATARHLGDEWGSSTESQKLFDEFLRPRLTPQSVVLEVGPGGGKYTMMAAPLVARVVAVDVALEMLRLTCKRAAAAGQPRVHCMKIGGLDLGMLRDASVDVAFSFDVLVHLDPEDSYAYLQEFRRVLRPGGVGAVTLASFLTAGGFQKFLRDVEVNRGARKSSGRFGFLTPTVAAKFLFHLGFKIVGYSDEINNRDFVMVFEKAEGESRS